MPKRFGFRLATVLLLTMVPVSVSACSEDGDEEVSGGDPQPVSVEIAGDMVTISSPSEDLIGAEFDVDDTARSGRELALMRLSQGVTWNEFLDEDFEVGLPLVDLDPWGTLIVQNLDEEPVPQLEAEASYGLVLVDPTSEVVIPVVSLNEFTIQSSPPDTLFQTVDTLFSVQIGN